MRLYLLILFLLLPNLNAQDLHPEIRSLIFEALDLAKGTTFDTSRLPPQETAAELLARSGYTSDAEKLLKEYRPQATSPPYFLWLAWAAYGQSQKVEAYLSSTKDPNNKIDLLNAYANLLWRLGDKQKAKETYLAAQALLPRVTNLKKRINAKNDFTLGLKYVDDDAPSPVSIQTKGLPGRGPIPSLASRFPISPNALSSKIPIEREANAAFDEKTIQEIYASLRTGNLQALDQIVNSSKSPFQKALALASVQHILNQSNLGDSSEICAQAIPSSDVDSKLAKAEALGSAATILVANGAKNRARALMIAAVDLATSVPDLLMPRVEILAILAMRQASAGFETDARDTYTRAIEMGARLPFAPALWNQRKLSKYREDVISKLIFIAVEYNQLALADMVVESNAGTNHVALAELGSTLFHFGEYARALTVLRSIPDPRLRSQELFDVALSWLNLINAPNL
jgi:tetratricopeptide (TPR) repeat protein